jgi:hypothetical protein
VTIVAGFVSTDGLLLCADREERDGTSKKDVNKVLCMAGDDWHVAIGGAGPSAIIELAFKRLRKRFESIEDEAGIQSEHEEILRNELFNLHEQYVWPSKQVDYRFSLLVGINLKRSKQTFLYRTQEYIPEPVQTFCCIGIGADLANYFADRLYNVFYK